MKQHQAYGNTVGQAKDAAWMPHKAKLCTFMQSSKWANNHTQTKRPCLITWLSLSSVLTSAIVWGGLQCRYICRRTPRAPHKRQTVGWQMILTYTSCGAVTPSFSFTCEAHLIVHCGDLKKSLNIYVFGRCTYKGRWPPEAAASCLSEQWIFFF